MWKKELIEPVFSRIVPSLSSDVANETFLAVHALRTMVTKEESEYEWNRDAVRMVQQLYTQCYGYMVSNASLVSQARLWSSLPSELRHSIRNEAVFIDSRGKGAARKPVLTSSLMRTSSKPATVISSERF